MQPRSSSGSTSIDQRSSVAPSASPSEGPRLGAEKKSITCYRLITIAIVLGLKGILEEGSRLQYGVREKDGDHRTF